MAKVFVTRRIPEPGLAILREVAEVKVWEEELPPPREVLLKEVADCDALVPLLTDRVDGELLDRAPHLKVVANYAVGYDNIDVPACTARGVLVTNTPGVLTETTADLAFALILAAARRLVEADKFLRAGK
ncbi:MAG: hydroxyacid dehydrogenase, partial [Arcobacter sp.]